MTSTKDYNCIILRFPIKTTFGSFLPPIVCRRDIFYLGVFVFVCVQKAEILNKYFSSISNLNDENKVLPDYDCKCLNVLSDIEVCEQDVIDIISTLNVDKAVGHDIISNRMLLAVKNEIAKPLSMLFNRSIQEMFFPDQWKIAHVIALFKKGDKSLPSNYRPVSLLSCVSKILEKKVYKQIYNHLHINKLLYKF